MRLGIVLALTVGWLGSCAASQPGAARPVSSQASARPNVIVILADDMGFSDLGCYGGEIRTPNIDKLAADGVRFTQFYNMARCCPTRASLMTGVYPHQAGMGAMNQDLGVPAYQGQLRKDVRTVAEVLRGEGYRTGMAGKWHLSHTTIASVPGPKQKAMLAFEDETPISPDKSTWPANRGFEQHWGTIPGVDSFWDPYGLVHNEEVIKPEGKDFYYTDFITEHAVKMVDDFATSQKPFFLYMAYTAPHWPMHAREEDIARYADTYKVGWDAVREARFRKQVELGIVKKEWALSPRAFNRGLNDGPSAVGPWEEAKEKDWQARRMAVYAGMIECMDRGVGRVMETLKARGIDDNTIVIFLSDNGACQENVQQSWYDIPNRTRDGRKIAVGNKAGVMPGGEESYQSYGPAWANASNTPFRRFKHFTEEGGISAPFVVRWPDGRLQAGRLETGAVGHVIDVVPTILEAAKVADRPAMEGRSLWPAIQKGDAGGGRVLCWEHEGNRAVRIGDWKLVGPHGEEWRLFNVVEDRTELKNRAGEMPEKVAELEAAYAAWAQRCGVQDWPVRKR